MAPNDASSVVAFNHETDLLVIGGGVAGLSATLFGEINGLRTLLCEKTSLLGGTTASSGGIVWAPLSGHAKRAGVSDSREDVRAYLRSELEPYFNAELADAFLESAHKAIDTLETSSEVRFSYVPWPDYHPDRPGGVTAGRTLEAQRFD